MENKSFIWSYLLQLGSNMWNDEHNTRSRDGRSNQDAYPVLRFDRKLWDAQVLDLKAAGCNTLIIDLGEAMFFESHPELAVAGSWSHDQMRAEVERLKALGFEVVPKLNFSACHDVWLKDYSRMLSTPIYYQVCSDVIKEVCEVFKPKYFHIGMDEETAAHQINQDYVVVRQFDLWWKDFYYLVNCVEREGARAWIWSDYIWEHTEEFVRKMIIALLVPRIPAKRHVLTIGECIQQSRKILHALTILHRKLDAVPHGGVHHVLEVLNTLRRRLCLLADPAKGMQHHDRHANARTILHATDPIPHKDLTSLAALPQKLRHIVLRVNGLKFQSHTVRRVTPYAKLIAPSHKKYVKADLAKERDLLGDRYPKAVICRKTQFSFHMLLISALLKSSRRACVFDSRAASRTVYVFATYHALKHTGALVLSPLS